MNNLYGLVAVIAIGVVIWIVSVLTASFKEKSLIKSGILPDVANTTDSDIKKLAQSGHKIWAIKRYREIHNVSLKEAKKKIEAM